VVVVLVVVEVVVAAAAAVVVVVMVVVMMMMMIRVDHQMVTDRFIIINPAPPQCNNIEINYVT